MAIPDVLALDFDGVLCDGMREYFETSRRTYARAWPDESLPGDELFAAFRRLRPVILSGWEMPLLLRAIAGGRSDKEIFANWERVRDDVAQALWNDSARLVGLPDRSSRVRLGEAPDGDRGAS